MDPAAAPAQRADAPASDPGRLLVSLVALGVPAAQLVFRAADDNRLTSWRWVFEETDPLRLFAVLAAALAVAHVAARAPYPPRPALALFLCSCAAAACFWRAPEVIVDASRYFTQAKHLEVYGLSRFLSGWGTEFQAWTDLPLVPALYGVVLATFGESRTALQAFTTLLFAGAVVLTQRLGRALWDDEVGFAGAALLLAIPYLLTQVPSVLVDVPTMFFVTLAMLAAVHAVRRGGAGRLLLAAAAILLALLSKYSAWLLLSGLPAVALAFRAEAPRAVRRLSAIALAAVLLLATALLLERDVVARQLGLLLGYQAPGLRRWGESFLSTFLFQVHPFLTAGALASVWLAVRRRDARWLVVAWPVLLLVFLQVRRIRYWVPAFPMVALMAAYGLRVVRAPRGRLAVACAVAGSLVVAVLGPLPFLERASATNLAEAGAYLDALEEPAVEVFTARSPGAEVNPAVSVPLLDLFTAKRVIYAYEPPPQPPPGTERSPLRFTWEYRNPRYYADGGAAASAAVVVVSGDLAEPLPAEVQRRVDGLHLARVFAADEGVFAHRTLVRVYRAPPPSRSARDE